MAAATQNPIDTPASEFAVQRLLDTDLVRVRQVDCRGTCRHRSAEECACLGEPPWCPDFVEPLRGRIRRELASVRELPVDVGQIVSGIRAAESRRP
jgi:hypothetical protein